MKPELSEQLFIEELFENSREKLEHKDVKLNYIDKLTGDASTRRYYRLDCGPESYVACLDNPTEPEKNSFVNVQQFLFDHNIRVPKIHDMNLKRGYILEEDLGNVTLLHYLSSIDSIEEEERAYKKIIKSLVDIHTIDQKNIDQSKIFDQKFDFEKYQWEIEFTLDFYFKRFLKIKDPGEIKEILQEFKPICKNLAEQKMVLTHRDFHSRNIMVSNEEFIIIDFQDARWGIPQYDLASLLDDCYYKVHENIKIDLKKYYYEHLPSDIHGQGSFQNFLDLYDDMVIQRVFKAIGSFGYIFETRKDVRYIKYVGFAMEKIRKVMMKNPKYTNLRKVMFRNYYAS